VPDAKVDEEAEKKWLSEMERVESHIFEGKKLARENGTGKPTATNKDIAKEWNRADRRIGKNTTVEVDGFAISKESMQCEDWEAVPTFAGKDPRLAEPKRAKKEKPIPQSHCQICFDGGLLHCCQLCPRAYHYNCLEPEFKTKANSQMFNCPQHQCADCEQKTTDAGGMLFRCRWCERAFCEDCLDWEKVSLLGETLKEYELLGYAPNNQAFYIQCHGCTDHFEVHPSNKGFCDDHAKEVDAQYARFQAASAVMGEQIEMESLSDGTTIETPGVSTPAVIDLMDEILGPIVGRKRKMDGAMESGNGGSAKRVRLSMKPKGGR
jgi:SWI/SNF-related matrix-associated actin-dependent regulator of chromatin subfamily A member 5